jgi:hypothetical protein
MQAYESVVASFEKFYASLGMMDGGSASLKRLLFGAVIGGILVTYVKPSFMFNPDGTAKTWVFFSEGEEDDSTVVPWWIVPTFTGIYSGVFI